MGRFLLKRLLQTVIILIIISILAFSLIHIIPGDPVYAMLGTDITPEYHDQVYHSMGLDLPLVQQYFRWTSNFIKGQMGYSYHFKEDVSSLVARRLPPTLILGIASAIFSVILGLLFGIITAVRRGKPIDSVLTVLANIGIATPIFWLAVLLVFIFSIKLRVLPAWGFTLPWVDFAKSMKQMLMPVLCMSVGGIASYTRQTRSSMLEVIGQDYIRTARSKGLKEGKIISGHAVKNALIPILTLIGLTLRNSIGGSAIIERVFNITGMGSVMVEALAARDYIALQSGIVFLALITCICNLLVDIAYAYADPRIRLE
ncbi:MAG: ABC transporter permease [Firmicutes bacterium]|nr:ABC transporter permease [Bacillota bacterium]